MPITDTTTNRGYQKPNIANALSDDVTRIRTGLDSIDTDVSSLLPRLLNSANGAASSPPGVFSGTWFSGGTSTTTKPQILIEPSGATSTNWSTSGTGLGVNAATGFTGNLVDVQLNGAARFRVTSAGNAVAVTVTTTSTTVASLPSAATAGAGARGFVTDATATTFLSTVAGGGANKVPVVSDGTNWLIG